MKDNTVGVIGSIVAFGIIAAIWNVLLAGEDMQKLPRRSIVIALGDDPSVFGRTTSLHVRYENGAETAWDVSKPDGSIAVRLRYRSVGTDAHPYGYTLGKYTVSTITDPRGQPVIATVAPKDIPMSIQAGKMYEFDVEFEREWTGNVVPGRWEVWLDDQNLGLKSNVVVIPLRFTSDSVAACLAVAKDKEQHVSKRKAHAEWLQKIMPALKLQWWKDGDTPEEQRRSEEEIQKNLKAFETFRNNKDNAKAIEEAIQGINRDAGFDPEESNATSKPTTAAESSMKKAKD